jgi:hypothetical protein
MARTPNETKPRPMVAAWENEGEARDGCVRAGLNESRMPTSSLRRQRGANPTGASNLDEESARCIATLVDQLLPCCRCSIVTWT